MARTSAEFIFFNGVNFIIVQRTFSEVKSIYKLADYAYNSDFAREYFKIGYYLKTINIL